MLTIFKDSKQVGTLDARLRLTTKSRALRKVIEEAKDKGLAHWFRPPGPDVPGVLSDGVKLVKAGDDFITELRRLLRLNDYEINTKGRP